MLRDYPSDGARPQNRDSPLLFCSMLLGKFAPFFGFAMRSIGRGLQMIGLGVPPLAIVLQLSEAISLAQMLTMLVATVCCFGIGRILEGYAQ